MEKNRKSKSKIEKVNATAYFWNHKEEEHGAVEDYKILWGIVENLENKKIAVKFIVEFDQKKLAIWISDLLSVILMQKMNEDFIRMRERRGEREDDEDLDELLPKLTEGVNMILSELKRGESEGKRYEQIVIDLCKQWNFTKEQTNKVLALLIGTAKLVEEMFVRRGEAMEYIY